jgi:hypothetical protein
MKGCSNSSCPEKKRKTINSGFKKKEESSRKKKCNQQTISNCREIATSSSTKMEGRLLTVMFVASFPNTSF